MEEPAGAQTGAGNFGVTTNWAGSSPISQNLPGFLHLIIRACEMDVQPAEFASH
jgi:hypothetical protein